jgi:hypothetical protein
MFEEVPRSKGADAAGGMVIVWVCNFLNVIVGAILAASSTGHLQNIGIYIIMGLPIVQFIYVVPLALRARRSGTPEFMQGMIIASSVTFLICAACYGYFWQVWFPRG